MSSLLFDHVTHQRKDEAPCSSAELPPHPSSYDSGEEFSLAHFVHDCELVDQEDVTSEPILVDDEYLPVS
jgi:hypothetical protein